MKRIITIITVWAALVSATFAQLEVFNPGEMIAKAALAYEQGDYASATVQYEALAESFKGSPDLYYALGNCYYKQQQYAKAILNYERCLYRDPSNDDARNNLEMARLNCVDKIETLQPIIFVSWSNALRDSLSANGWTNLSVGLFIAFLVCVACFFFMRKVAIRKTGFYGALVLVVVCAIAMAYAHAQTNRQNAHDEAVVMAPTVTVRSTPAESGTQLLIIHEGLKVRIRQELSGWSEIELSDGNVGWMPTSQLEVI